ncbi:hypothetical protein Vafri_14458 [Volvox africanus]|uniref:RNA helicase n=1 Tax=Volvox africanus TaxID=51714 RepID=A0A8J4BIZ6_9CHLO|nr:hypothetical protein Vafri_14458 [Volvox africanus]
MLRMRCYAATAVQSQVLETCSLGGNSALWFCNYLSDVCLREALANGGGQLAGDAASGTLKGFRDVADEGQQAVPLGRDIRPLHVTSTPWHPTINRSSAPAAAVLPPCNANAITTTRSETFRISACIIPSSSGELIKYLEPRTIPVGLAARRLTTSALARGATLATDCSGTTTIKEAERGGDGGSGGGVNGQCGNENNASSGDNYDDTRRDAPRGSDTARWGPGGRKGLGRPPDPGEAAAALTDLTRPASWYPLARSLKRKVVAHLGPTNSGKTHAALQALKAAPSGIYCGPLRLLACEVADRLAAEGLPCNLVTGQEVRRAVGAHGAPARHTACTIEMADVKTRLLSATDGFTVDHVGGDLHSSCGGSGGDGGGGGGGGGGGAVTHFDVAVLDEIQMLGDRLRGWAWTRALLGLAAREVHVAGDSAALPVLRDLVADCGDELQVRHYRRLSPLVVQSEALGSMAAVAGGDCLVAFSRRGLHGLRKEVARRAGREACLCHFRLHCKHKARTHTRKHPHNKTYGVCRCTAHCHLRLGDSRRRYSTGIQRRTLLAVAAIVATVTPAIAAAAVVAVAVAVAVAAVAMAATPPPLQRRGRGLAHILHGNNVEMGPLRQRSTASMGPG